MKFYKVNNEVMAIEQGQEFLVKADWVEMTVEEIELFKNPPKTLEQAKEAKRNEIRNVFNTQSELPVLVGTVSYHGGFDSATKLDAAKRMVEASGGTEVTFFDTTNLPHVLTLLEATTVILTIGADYQTKFAKKQSKMVVVENAININEVEAVVW